MEDVVIPITAIDEILQRTGEEMVISAAAFDDIDGELVVPPQVVVGGLVVLDPRFDCGSLLELTLIENRGAELGRQDGLVFRRQRLALVELCFDGHQGELLGLEDVFEVVGLLLVGQRRQDREVQTCPQIVVEPGVDKVGAIAAIEVVAAELADECVVAQPAIDQVAQVAADENIIAETAILVVHTSPADEGIVAADWIAVLVAVHEIAEDVLTGFEPVVARPAAEDISPGVAAKGVVAGFAVERVGAVTAL